TLVAKLRRRHPHVFARSEARTSAEVTARWDVIKAQEKQRESVMDGIPAGLPALARTQKMLSRAERAGIDIATDTMAEQVSAALTIREAVSGEQGGPATTDAAPLGVSALGAESAGPSQAGSAHANADPAGQIGAE